PAGARARAPRRGHSWRHLGHAGAGGSARPAIAAMNRAAWSSSIDWWRPTSATVAVDAVDARPVRTPAGPVDARVPFWALMAFTFILIISPQTIFKGLAPLRLAFVSVVVAVVAYVLHRLMHGLPVLVFSRELQIAENTRTGRPC